jgi:hypothetical protein
MDDIEIVDLAENVSSRSDGKTNNFHTKEPDNDFKLSIQKPQFSVASGARLDLSLLTKSAAHDDIFDSDSGEEFPPLSDLMGDDRAVSDSVQATMSAHQKDPTPYSSIYDDDSMGSLEAAMVDLEDSGMLRKTPVRIIPSPKIESNFKNGYFDRSASQDNTTREDVYPSPLVHEVYGTYKFKRALSPALELPALKHRRVKKVETVQTLPENDQENIPQQMDTQAASSTINTPQQPSLPDWVNDIDPELFEDLKDFVDFVD